MPAKAVTFGIALVMTVAIVASLVELFVPLAAKANMNACCRNTLVRMEVDGGLTGENIDDLEDRLRRKGFSNIEVSGTARAARGETLALSVKADYVYSRLTGLYKRKGVTQTMAYERVSASRKVLN